ncbi:MAG: hypothetical protein IJK49_01460 [Prevotella sp.]|nr:hypothetical protein [Prevotella sp.]
MKKTCIYLVALLGMVLSLASCGDDYKADSNSFDLSTMTEQEILSTFVGEWKVDYKHHREKPGDKETDEDTQRWVVKANGEITIYSHDEDKDFTHVGDFEISKEGGKVYLNHPMLWMVDYSKYELKSLTATTFLIQSDYDDGYLKEYHYIKGKKK